MSFFYPQFFSRDEFTYIKANKKSSSNAVMSLNEEEAVMKIPSPSTVIFSGVSGSGKSTLVYKILKNARGMFETFPTQIIFCYNIYQTELYDRLKKDVGNIQFFRGLPEKSDLEGWGSCGNHCVLILDDLMSQCSSSQHICDLFTIFSHHLNFTVLFLIQNLYSYGKQFRTISLNAHQFFLFNSPRDLQQIKIFAKQCFPLETNYFMDSYKRAVTSRKFGYLVVDLSPSLSEEESQYRLRTNILPGETTIVYLPCDKQL